MQKKPKRALWITLAVIVLAGLLAVGGIYRVNQGEQALVITLGKVTDTNGPGLYWHIPFVQRVIANPLLPSTMWSTATALGGQPHQRGAIC